MFYPSPKGVLQKSHKINLLTHFVAVKDLISTTWSWTLHLACSLGWGEEHGWRWRAIPYRVKQSKVSYSAFSVLGETGSIGTLT